METWKNKENEEVKGLLIELWEVKKKLHWTDRLSESHNVDNIDKRSINENESLTIAGRAKEFLSSVLSFQS